MKFREFLWNLWEEPVQDAGACKLWVMDVVWLIFIEIVIEYENSEG